MKQAIALIALACAASLFAQVPEVQSIDSKISCRASFDEVKDVGPRDAAADRMRAYSEARIRALEKIPKEKRNTPQYESELETCNFSVDLFRAQIERTSLNQDIINAHKEVSKIKDSIINLWVGDAQALDASLDRLNKDSQKALAEKDRLLNKQKEEADKKLEALRSKTISVFKDARGTILSMNSDILFETAKWDLKPELRENLAEISGILKNLLTESTVEIGGHTDNVGKPDKNKTLSQKRANAVKEYLAQRGVDKKRLKAVGYGQTKPVADNSTDEGKNKNRRVELVIKDK